MKGRWGFSKKNCKLTFFLSFLDINECLSDPCLHNGTCVDSINSYPCDCVPGYNGSNCVKGKLKKRNDICYANTNQGIGIIITFLMGYAYGVKNDTCRYEL